MVGRNYKKNIFSEKVKKEPNGVNLKHIIILSIYSFCSYGFTKGNNLHYASTAIRPFYATENNDAHIIKAITRQTMSMSNSAPESHWNAYSAAFFCSKKYAVKRRIYNEWVDLNYSLVFKKSNDLWEMLQD